MAMQLSHRWEDAMQLLLEKVRNGIRPVLTQYLGSGFASRFERASKTAAVARLKQRAARLAEGEESVCDICKEALFETLESMPVPSNRVSEEYGEDLLGLVYGELERLIQAEQAQEKMSGSTAEEA